jgi:hypothetical protein
MRLISLQSNIRSSKLGGQKIGIPFPTGTRNFSSPQRPEALMPTQPPIQWVPGERGGGGVNGLGARLTPPPVSRSGIRGAIPPFSHTPLKRV